MLKDAVRAWKKEKNQEAAIQQFNQVIRLDPQNAEALFSLGVVYEARGDSARALELYTKAHDINPDSMDYKSAIMTLNEKLGDKKVNDSKQGEVDELAQEAAGAFKRKEYISALELYKRLEQQFPKHAVYKYNIGTLYLLMQNPVQALEYYQMAKKLKPKEERYVEAVKKLEHSIDADEEKREAADQLWDKKEKNDAKAAKQAERDKKNNKGGQQGRAPAMQPPQNPLGIQISPTRDGVLVNGVSGGTRAAKAGLKGGDVIVAVDGVNTQNPGQLMAILSRKGPNEKAQLIINRKGKIDQLLY